MNRVRTLVLFTVFIDVVGLGIVIPILPFYVETFASSPSAVTMLIAVYAAASFLSAPLLGTISDRIGRRPILIASLISTAAGWVVFALAQSLPILFLGRIIDGAAAGNLPIAQAALTDTATNDKERGTYLGYIGAIFGIAFIIGPFIGGTLGHISPTLPFWFVGGLATINTILAVFFLPETKKFDGEERKPVSFNPFKPIVGAFRDLNLRANYIALFLFGLAISASQSTLSLYLQRVFSWDEFAIGLLFAGVGIIIALNQAFMMRKFWLTKFREPDLELWTTLAFAVGYILIGLQNMATLVVGIVVTTFGQAILRVVMNSQILSRADSKKRGESLGVSSSLISLSAVVAPATAGILFAIDVRIPFWAAGVCLVGAFAVLFRNRKNLPQNLGAENPIVSEI